jgi:hypothetical protein
LDKQKLSKLLELNRKDYINEMFKMVLNERKDKKDKKEDDNFLKKNNNMVRIILEEVPIYSIEHIRNYLNKLIIYYKYDFLNPVIKVDDINKQFQFTNVAIKDGTLPNELFSYHETAPQMGEHKYNTIEYNYKIGEIEKEDIKLPMLFKGDFEKLESKWTMHKKSKWFNMEILKVRDYKDEYFKEFFEWFSDYLNIKTISYANLLEISYNKLRIIRNDEINMKQFLTDRYYLKLFSKEIAGKSINTVNVFWDKYYGNMTNSERLEVINNLIKNNKIRLNDLLILSMAELLDINILTIHRASYGTTKDKDIRGNIEDLIVSTSLYKAPVNYNNRPLLILYKYKNELNEISYHLILDKTIKPIGIKNLYMKLNDTPEEIQRLINEHIRITNETNFE